jgi:hypothetical protein
VASPAPLFPSGVSGAPTRGSIIEYDVSKDGRFLMNTLVEQAGSPITLILNRAGGSD